MTSDDKAGEIWLAIGLDLTLAATADGGRRTALVLSEPFGYRPNWGLPAMTGTEQTGAPVLCSSAVTLEPGDSARVVIVPLTDYHMTQWRLLNRGDKLRMFEGPRVRGHATVCWIQATSRPLPAADTARYRTWAEAGGELPDPQ